MLCNDCEKKEIVAFLAEKIFDNKMSRNQHAYSNPIQQDWDDREFIEVIQLNIIKTANFLNEFDITIRSRISKLNEKLSKLERSVEFCEAVIKSTQDRMKQTENL